MKINIPKKGLHDAFQKGVLDNLRNPYEVEREEWEEAWSLVGSEHRRRARKTSVGDANRPI